MSNVTHADQLDGSHFGLVIRATGFEPDFARMTVGDANEKLTVTGELTGITTSDQSPGLVKIDILTYASSRELLVKAGSTVIYWRKEDRV